MTSTDPLAATADVAYASIDAVVTAMGDGALTSADLARALRLRIDVIDAPGGDVGLRAVLALADDAVAVAEERDRERTEGRLRGPLHGVPVLVKDNIEVTGLPGTAGSQALVGRTVTADAPLVARLREAGAVILGSTNLSEWANFRSPHSVSGWSGVGGLTGNPWALDRSAGGSSSGSGAAVAAGLAPVAIGTETNGSITCPAALNGVVGLKPTVGSVSARQVVPISASQDVPGPLARSVADVALVYEVLSGRGDCRTACTSEAAASLRVGVVEQWLSGHAGTDALFASAIDMLTGVVAGVVTVDLPPNDLQVHDDQVTVLVHEMADDLDAYLAARSGSGVRSLAQAVAFNREHPDAELAHFGQEYLEAALASGGRATSGYRQARERNVAFARDACLGPAFAAGVDVLVSPAYQPAWKSDLVHGDQVSGGGANCTPPAILGWPILTVPMGTVDGLPVGFSIVGQAHSEPLLLSVGHALEQVLGLAGSPALRPAGRSVGLATLGRSELDVLDGYLDTGATSRLGNAPGVDDGVVAGPDRQRDRAERDACGARTGETCSDLVGAAAELGLGLVRVGQPGDRHVAVDEHVDRGCRGDVADRHAPGVQRRPGGVLGDRGPVVGEHVEGGLARAVEVGSDGVVPASRHRHTRREGERTGAVSASSDTGDRALETKVVGGSRQGERPSQRARGEAGDQDLAAGADVDGETRDAVENGHLSGLGICRSCGAGDGNG